MSPSSYDHKTQLGSRPLTQQQLNWTLSAELQAHVTDWIVIRCDWEAQAGDATSFTTTTNTICEHIPHIAFSPCFPWMALRLLHFIFLYLSPSVTYIYILYQLVPAQSEIHKPPLQVFMAVLLCLTHHFIQVSPHNSHISYLWNLQWNLVRCWWFE